MGRGRKKIGVGVVDATRYDVFGNVVASNKPEPVNSPTPVMPISEVPPKPPAATVKPIATEVTASDDRVQKAQDALKKAQDELREHNRAFRRLKADDEDLRQLLILEGKSINAPSAAERQSAGRKLRTELAKRGIQARDLRRLRDATYDKANEFEDKKAKIEQKIKDAEYQLVVASSPIDFSKRPKIKGKAQPQGPMQIDMARMSPEEIVDRIEKFSAGKTEGQFYRALFASLRHPNAAQVPTVIDSRLNKSEIQAMVDGLYGMFDAQLFAKPRTLTFESGIQGIMRGVAAAAYRPSTHTIALSRTGTGLSVIAHELAHAIEHQVGKINDVTEKWALHRVAGEKPVKSLRIGNKSITAPGGNVYRDHVDDPYTLHDFNTGTRPGKQRFGEVFSTGIENMRMAHAVRDKQLFMTFIRAVQEANGYY